MKKSKDLSIVLGSKNRKGLIKATIDSIRNNGFDGTLEIIVVDGGSTDGTCDWLAKQTDVILQSFSQIIPLLQKTVSRKGHTHGESL